MVSTHGDENAEMNPLSVQAELFDCSEIMNLSLI